MAIDVHGFVAPESDLRGLYKLSDTIERKQYKADIEKERKQAQQQADIKFLSNYFDPKEHLTGSPLDPQTNVLLSKAFNQALELNKQGASTSQILGATAPLVNQLNDYMVKGRAFNEQAKMATQQAVKITGVNQGKLLKQMQTMAFPIDPKTGEIDVTKFDPNNDYADLALRSGDVYDNQGFDEFIKGAKLNTVVGKAKSTNSKGGFTRHDAELSAPNFYVSETDADGNHIGFVPAHEIATEEGSQLMHEFRGEDGKTVKAPIRLLDKQVFNDLPPAAKGYVLQEARRYANEHGIELNSVQAENFARAIAYDELNSKSKKYGTVKNITETKAAPIKNVTNVNVNAGGSSPINDLYSRISEATQNPDITVYGKPTGTRFNSLDADAQELIVGYVNKGREIKIEPEELFLTNEGGDIKVYKLNDKKQPIPEGKNLLYTLPKTGTNLKAAIDVKNKREVVKQGQSAKGVKFADLDPNGFTKEGKYWKYKDGTLFDDKGNVVNK